jgi:hypothetical protein
MVVTALLLGVACLADRGFHATDRALRAIGQIHRNAGLDAQKVSSG